VVGHPFEMTDREANNAAGGEALRPPAARDASDLPVHLADERLTSRERLGDASAPRRPSDPTRVDAYAAKLILETWLNG
jgi:putative holliday junction resolvase